MTRISVTQGTYQVTQEPDVVFTAFLGSCVSACVHDPVLQLGGMNHFLLPVKDACSGAMDSKIFGSYLMELLLNDLYRMGAKRKTIEIKLFGGAHILSAGTDPGSENVDFITKFMENEGLNVVSSSLRGNQGRQIEFIPFTGKVRQKFVQRTPDIEIEKQVAPKQKKFGELDLF